jgi:hypothetical protein
MGYTVKQVEEIASKLRALPVIEPPPKDLTKSDVVKMLAKEIKSLQKRGYSLEQIASSLKGEGLDISTPTLKSYMQKYKSPAVKAKAKAKSSVGEGAKQVASQELVAGAEAVGSDETVATPKSDSSKDNQKVRSSGSFVPRPDSVDL